MSTTAKKATTKASGKSVTTSRTKKAVSKKEEAQVAEKTMEQETAESFMSSFVFMEKTAAILDVSLETGKNVILHGKGGYGKSEFSTAYLYDKGIEPYVITMGSGMTTDRLFGGVDLMKFHETGKIEYLIENSFMNHEFVIFEELFDAPDFILEQLKDILSSGVFRNGSQVFEIKTRNIICCTNKTRDEFAKNLSLRALMERFPLELEVKWDNHNRLTYEKLFESKFGQGASDPMLTFVLEEFAKKGHTISPRIALVAHTVVTTCGPESLEFIADFKAKADILKEALAKFKSVAEISEKVLQIKEILSQVAGLIEYASEKNEIEQAKKLNAKLLTEINALSKIKADDSMAVSTAKQVESFKKIYEENKKTFAVTAIVEDMDADF